jgi:hypothetical protein
MGSMLRFNTPEACLIAYDGFDRVAVQDKVYDCMLRQLGAAPSASSKTDDAYRPLIEKQAKDYRKHHNVYVIDGALYGYSTTDKQPKPAAKSSSTQHPGEEQQQQAAEAQAAQQKNQSQTTLQQHPHPRGKPVLRRSTVLDVVVQHAQELKSCKQLRSKELQKLKQQYLGLPAKWVEKIFKYIVKRVNEAGNS